MEITVPGLIIQPVNQAPDALAGILEVYRQCEDFLALGPVAAASIEMVLADLELSRAEGGVYYTLSAAATGEMLGVLDVVESGFEGDPAIAYLSLLMIAAPHRGKGLGEAVVRAVEKAIRENPKVRAIRAGVQVNNPGGIRFWARMGYKTITGPIDFPDGTTAFQLLKEFE